MTPGGSTRLAAVIGSPVAHSRSPAIFNAAFAATGRDIVYLAFDIHEHEVSSAIHAMRTLALVGYSVTMPLKHAVVEHVDELTPAAAALGAVNSIANHEGRLVGHNTDGGGLVASLEADHGCSPLGRSCAVLGAGGAARSVVVALAAAGASEVCVVNRTRSRAEAAADLAPVARATPAPADLRGTDLVVNATSIGMAGGPDPDGMPCDPAAVPPDAVAVDLVYHPAETPWLAVLRQRGSTTVNGLGMLIHQAAAQFTAWTGAPAPLTEMRSAALATLADGGPPPRER